MTSATGFAIVSFGKINIASVSPQARGAKVNWLVTEARLCVTQFHTDEDIERMWNSCRRRDHECVEVTITKAMS